MDIDGDGFVKDDKYLKKEGLTITALRGLQWGCDSPLKGTVAVPSAANCV